ncbi:MAG TPA: ATP-binding protein, partial [Rhodothermales bacterium]|nr:ATP-binding protein [Rhodothermales bacterium]
DEYQRLPKSEEMLYIAQQQIKREAEAEGKANRILFCDTTPLTTAIYARYYFGSCDMSLWELATRHRYDLVVLADDDISWEADGIQRDGPAVRAALQAIFRQTLDELKMPYTVVSGGIEDRIQQIKPLLDTLIHPK